MKPVLVVGFQWCLTRSRIDAGPEQTSKGDVSA